MNSVLSTPESKQGTHSLKYEDDASYYSVIKVHVRWCFCFTGRWRGGGEINSLHETFSRSMFPLTGHCDEHKHLGN